jgi:hypothetical protein
MPLAAGVQENQAEKQMTYDNWKARNRAEENYERPEEDDGRGDERPILTRHISPPIPLRQFDWQATRDGYEPGDAIGWGLTENEAIADLQNEEEERREEAMPPDLMDQIRRSMVRMGTLKTADIVHRQAAALIELIKIFAAYDREPPASDFVQRMREIWK